MIVVDMLSPGAIVAIAGRGKDRHHSGTNALIAASASPPAHRRQRVAASASPPAPAWAAGRSGACAGGSGDYDEPRAANDRRGDRRLQPL
jgi:hypothetical protein